MKAPNIEKTHNKTHKNVQNNLRKQPKILKQKTALTACLAKTYGKNAKIKTQNITGIKTQNTKRWGYFLIKTQNTKPTFYKNAKC